jgi:O-antigen/teichoic acid export membrane protein
METPQTPLQSQKGDNYRDTQGFEPKTIITQAQSHGLTLILQLVSSIFIARNLGPTNLGELALIQTLILLVKPLLDAGTKGYLIREFVKDTQITTQLQWARAATRVSTKTSMIVLVVVWLLSTLLSTANMLVPEGTQNDLPKILSNPQIPLLWGYCLGFVVISNIFEEKGYAQLLLLKDIKRYLYQNLIVNSGSSILKVALALTIGSPTLLIALFFTTMGLEHIVKGVWNRQAIKKYNNDTLIPGTCSKKEKILLKESINHLPSELSLGAEGQVPKLLLSNLGGDMLGNYTVAQKNTIISRTLNRMSHDNDLHNPSIKVGVKYALLATVLSMLTPPLIPILYGEEFKDAVLYAYLLILPGVLTIVGAKITTKLIKQSLTTAASKINIVGVTVSALLCIALMPSYNVWGAVLGLCTGWIIQISLGVWLLRYNKLGERAN